MEPTTVTVTAENVEAIRAEIIKKAYAEATNTYGHQGCIIEKREENDKSPEAWVPMERYGSTYFGDIQVPDRYYTSDMIWVNLLYYPDGQEAATFANYLKESNRGFTFRIKRYKLPQDAAEQVEAANTWKAREASRFTDGTYTPLPFAQEEWFKEEHGKLNHFAHVSTEDKGKIAYTRDHASGVRNIKTRVSVGRYLQEYFSHVLSFEPRKETGGTNTAGEKITVDALQWYVKNFNNQYGGGTTLKFASTRDDIAEVYENGPSSCMSYPAGDYSCDPVHPTEVYAAGDLQLAYLEDEAEDGRITARALVWPERKAVGRIYGDVLALSAALEEAGYSREDACSLNGARLLKIPHNNGYVMPFIDGAGNYGPHATDPDYFQIGGRKCATYTSGIDHEDSESCSHCGEYAGELSTVYVNRYGDAEYWCECCVETRTFYCEESNERYASGLIGAAGLVAVIPIVSDVALEVIPGAVACGP